MGLISGCSYLKLYLKAKCIYMLTLLSKGVPKKLLKFFWWKIFFICHRCQRHRWSTLNCEYLREFSKKFETVLMGYSGAGGKLIDEKNQKQKISWHCPLKLFILFIPNDTNVLESHCLHCVQVSNLKKMKFNGFWPLVPFKRARTAPPLPIVAVPLLS